MCASLHNKLLTYRNAHGSIFIGVYDTPDACDDNPTQLQHLLGNLLKNRHQKWNRTRPPSANIWVLVCYQKKMSFLTFLKTLFLKVTLFKDLDFLTKVATPLA